jgi:hypothetical protein
MFGKLIGKIASAPLKIINAPLRIMDDLSGLHHEDSPSSVLDNIAKGLEKEIEHITGDDE